MVAETRKYSPEKLDELLTFQGRSNVWVGERLGLDESYISRLRTGSRPITEPLANRIAELLGCPASLLVSDELTETAA